MIRRVLVGLVGALVVAGFQQSSAVGPSDPEATVTEEEVSQVAAALASRSASERWQALKTLIEVDDLRLKVSGRASELPDQVGRRVKSANDYIARHGVRNPFFTVYVPPDEWREELGAPMMPGALALPEREPSEQEHKEYVRDMLDYARRLGRVVRSRSRPFFFRLAAATALAHEWLYFGNGLSGTRSHQQMSGPTWEESEFSGFEWVWRLRSSYVVGNCAFAPLADELLHSDDLEVRVIMALALTEPWRIWRHRIPMVWKKIPLDTLIDGLEHRDFAVRFLCQRVLEEVTDQAFLLDPLDEEAERAKGIARWRAWWQRNRGVQWDHRNWKWVTPANPGQIGESAQ